MLYSVTLPIFSDIKLKKIFVDRSPAGMVGRLYGKAAHFNND